MLLPSRLKILLKLTLWRMPLAVWLAQTTALTRPIRSSWTGFALSVELPPDTASH